LAPGFYDYANDNEDLLAACHKRVYVLMTDGDIQFSTKDVRVMLDVARRDESIAGVAGRLRPTGSGLLAWFQRFCSSSRILSFQFLIPFSYSPSLLFSVFSFEYALSHYLSKTSEDILGTVLCSSSCFSLFRFCALESVIEDFAQVSKTAQQYQALEQGEDRLVFLLFLFSYSVLTFLPSPSLFFLSFADTCVCF
jgi:chitin synthase